MTGAEFLMKECDEEFTDEDLDAVGNAFAQAYYDANFFDDYSLVVPKGTTDYHVADNWANFDRVAAVLDERFQGWKQSHK